MSVTGTSTWSSSIPANRPRVTPTPSLTAVNRKDRQSARMLWRTAIHDAPAGDVTQHALHRRYAVFVLTQDVCLSLQREPSNQ